MSLRAFLPGLLLGLTGLLGCGGGSGHDPVPMPPVIASFTPSPATIPLGTSTALSWSVSGATSLRVDPSPGAVTGSGTTVAPTVPTTYTLTATNGAGSVQAQVSVNLTCAVSFTAGTGGSLTGALSQTVPYGGSATAVTAVPDPGYRFQDWTGSGVTPTATNPLVLTNVTTNLNLVASFTLQTFTVTFTAGSGGSLTGVLSQTVNYGGTTTAVTALPDPGYAFSGWSGSGFTPTTANPLTVSGVTGDLSLTASFTSLVPDLAAWLQANPAVAGAIQWQFQAPAGGNAYTPPGSADMVAWTDWSQAQKDDLQAAYQDAALWLVTGATSTITMPYRGVSDTPTNHYGNQSDATTVMQWMSPADMWNLYLAHVGFSLALETTGSVPWSLTTYDAESLRCLLSSSTLGWRLPYSVILGQNGIFSLGTYAGANLPALRANNRPITSFAHPMWTYQWMAQNGIIHSTRLDSIGGVLDWMRFNMWHWYGTDDFGTCNAVWQYKGYPPLSRIVGGTVDARYPQYNSEHWTLGCHGSVGFLAATLRALNIPVQPVWVGGHELACFLTEHHYLDHGDDPYNAVPKSYPSVSILNVLIDEATYQSRFTTDLTVNLNSPSPTVTANIGKAAADFH